LLGGRRRLPREKGEVKGSKNKERREGIRLV